MQIIPRRDLARLFRQAGLDPTTRDFPDAAAAHTLTVREVEPMPFTGGPHRKRLHPDGSMEGPFPLADRPALSQFLAAVFLEVGAGSVLATVPEGAFWLNNRAQSEYLHKVADAQQVTRFLRQRGLTDRFQGGFRIAQSRFEALIPRLAANTFVGGADVLFAALSPPSCRLTALSCHHFDLHFASPDEALLQIVADLAAAHHLAADTLPLLELPELPEIWGGS